MEVVRVNFDKTFKVTNLLLLAIGIRPCAEFDSGSIPDYFKKNWPFLTFFIILFYTTIAEAVYLLVTLREYFSFIEITSQIPCIGFCSIGLYKMLITSMRRNEMAEIVALFREMWPTRAKTAEQKNIVESYMLMCILFTTVFAVINIVMVSAFNFLPLAEMLYNRRYLNIYNRQLPYNIWMPFDSFEGDIYYAVYVFHVIAGCTVVIGNMGFDCLFCILTCHLCMHYKILQNDIEVCVKRGDEEKEKDNTSNAKDENIEELALCIKEHQRLIKTRKRIENIFSDIIFFNFFASSIIICLAGFLITTISGYNLIKFSLFLLCFLIELYLLCWNGNQIVENSLYIAHSVYNSFWYEASHKFRKSVLQIIHRSQRPEVLTALKFWAVSLESFGKILSASWSYFTLLKTVYKELPNHAASRHHGL